MCLVGQIDRDRGKSQRGVVALESVTGCERCAAGSEGPGNNTDPRAADNAWLRWNALAVDAQLRGLVAPCGHLAPLLQLPMVSAQIVIRPLKKGFRASQGAECCVA